MDVYEFKDLTKKGAASSFKVKVQKVQPTKPTNQNGNNRRDYNTFNPPVKLTTYNYLLLYVALSTFFGLSMVTCEIKTRNILHEIRKRKANSIGHILRRNCLLNKLSKQR